MPPRANGSDPPAKAPSEGRRLRCLSFPAKTTCTRNAVCYSPCRGCPVLGQRSGTARGITKGCSFLLSHSKGDNAVAPMSRSPGRHPAGYAPCELAPWGGGSWKHNGETQGLPTRTVIENECVCFGGQGGGGAVLPQKMAFHNTRKWKATQWLKPCKIGQTGNNWIGRK